MSVKIIETINKNDILDFFESKSEVMSKYIKRHYDSEYYLVYKYITHSDLTTKGKRNGSQESIDKNYLYYLSIDDMHKLEDEQEKPFESAKQSNINIPSKFYNVLGVKQLQRREGKQKKQHNHIVLNDYSNIYLVNDSLKYFTGDFTRRILDKLNKKPNWYNSDISVKLLPKKDFTPIQISHAIHGIGTSADKEFSKLRLNIFKNDIIILLIETRLDCTKNTFVMLDKNPIFYSILGETNLNWQKYTEKQRKIQEINLRNMTAGELEEEKTRKQQNKWRDLLAEEMMNYCTVDGEVFCPFTFINCNYNNLGTLFRASHIKAFKDCKNTVEAYDINNGLLLCANADALFDKYLISVDENKDLLFSFLLKNDLHLISRLLLSQPIFKLVLNEKRMYYMEAHRQRFYEEEEKRKRG